MAEEKPMRKFKKIPVFIVENHNEVLEFLYKCFRSRYLPFENNIMIHFDSHPDMTIPRYMPASYVYDKDVLLENVSIESWIMPAVFGGHISTIYWIRENWCKQIEKGHYSLLVGKNSDGFIATNSTLDYFLSEGTYSLNNVLTDEKSLSLEVMNLKEMTETDHNFDDASIILDIDLDYFSTHNPFLNIYDKADTYQKLKEFYLPPEKDDANLNDFIMQRNKQIDDLHEIFKYLEEHNTLENFKNELIPESVLNGIRNLSEAIKHHYRDETINWMMIHDGGCTCDHIELPHHESTPAEIIVLIKNLEVFLRKLSKPPTVITISRSSEDEYTPLKQVDFIQQCVMNTLNAVYADVIEDAPILWYKDDTIDF